MIPHLSICRERIARSLETISQVEPNTGSDLAPDPGLLLSMAGLTLLLGAGGSLVAAALLTYSPSKLARQLDTSVDAPAIEALQAHAIDYQVIARAISVCAVIASALFTWIALPDARLAGITSIILLSILLCGVVPSNVAEPRAESIIGWARHILVPIHRFFYYPLVLPMSSVARLLMRSLRIPTQPPTDPDEIAEEIADAVSDSTHENELDDDERSWIENIVELKDQQANQVMTPRTDIIAFEASMPLLEAVRRATMTGHSRYPVYEESLDKIIGMFYTKDTLPLLGRGPIDEGRQVKDLIRKPLFINEKTELGDLLQEFRSSKVQMAILLDEYGGTVGLVSIEDILEEIIGDITDEYDTEDVEAIRIIEEARVIETSGRTRVEAINDYLNVQIPIDGEYETVAGFVLNELDRVPKQNEIIYESGLEILILSANDRRIERTRITLINSQLANDRP